MEYYRYVSNADKIAFQLADPQGEPCHRSKGRTIREREREKRLSR